MNEALTHSSTNGVATERSKSAFQEAAHVPYNADVQSVTSAAKKVTVTTETAEAAALRRGSDAAARRAIRPPKPPIKDWLWLIVVASFAIVLVGSFATIAFGVIMARPNDVASQTVLTMFTSVVGFLAGLFTPSPGGRAAE